MKPEDSGQLDRQRRAELGHDKNVTPSMVVRQQRQLLQPADEASSSSAPYEGLNQQQQQQPTFDQDGLVLPKRVAHHNPTVPVSQQPIIRDLNRELKFNQIRGKNVLEQKSELKRALEKLEESKRKKEAEQERLNRRTSLELRLEERAERLAKETAAAAAAVTSTSTTTTTKTSHSELQQQQQQQHRQDSAKLANANQPTCNPTLANFSIRSITR